MAVSTQSLAAADFFIGALSQAQRVVEETLQSVLPVVGEGPEAELFAAMRYATLGAGKRLRPFLVMESARLFGVPDNRSVRAGAAVELIHSYSLVHDDLPSMDDDAMRRGKASCHVRFGEATAILSGDALMPLAFEVLADPATHPDPAVRVELTAILARAAGARGMVGGQMIDLAAERLNLDVAEISRLERLKTGSLIACACESGAILGGSLGVQRKALVSYAYDLGLAYQMADDLLDAEGDAEAMGKAVGKDAGRGKATFVSLLGAARARAEAKALVEQAILHLQPFGEKAALLRAVARYVVERPS